LKLGQNIYYNDISAEFKNRVGPSAARGLDSFPYWAVVKLYLRTRSPIFSPIFMKLSQNMCPKKILDEFENGSSWMKNIAAMGRGSFPYMALLYGKTLLTL